MLPGKEQDVVLPLEGGVGAALSASGDADLAELIPQRPQGGEPETQTSTLVLGLSHADEEGFVEGGCDAGARECQEMS